MAKLALADGVVGGIHGKRCARPQRCKEGVRPALQGSRVVVVEFGGENVGYPDKQGNRAKHAFS